jgi:hypothetical protein
MKNIELKLTPEVIAAINEELAYTSGLQAQGRADQADYGVEGQLITLYTYTQKALNAWTNNAGPEQSLHELRKVAAIAIRALLTAGCPRRAL